MATLQKLQYPVNTFGGFAGGLTTLTETFAGASYNIFPSKAPLYNVYKSQASTYLNPSIGTPITNDVIEIRVINNTDSFFILNGITYKSSTIINGKNLYLKEGNYYSMYNMFQANGILEDYDAKPGAYGSLSTSITLTAKNKGRSNYIDVSKLDNAVDTDTYNSNASVATNATYTVRKSIGDNVSQDVDNYEIGILIRKIIYYQNSIGDYINYEELITTKSKKGFGLVDFDISSIVDDTVEKWKPTINNFNINVNKFLEQYSITAYQKFVDKQDDPNNTFAVPYDNYFTNNLYVIDTRQPLFQKIDYIDNSNGLTAQDMQPNLCLENAGTYGGLSPFERPLNDSIYDRILTNQPRNKQMNRSFELLSNVNLTSDFYSQTGIPLNDRAVFTFTYNDNFTETVVLNSNNLKPDKTNNAYINQLSFKIDTLSSYTTSGLSISTLKYLDVHFETDIYAGQYPIKYESQRYYVDSTVQNCNDTEVDIDYIPFVFKNGKGGFDLFEFTTVQEINTNRAIQTIDTPYTWQSKKTSEFTKIWDTQYDKQYATKTRVLTNEEFIWMEDFVKSEEVYILDILTNDLYPVIVLSTSYNYKQNQDNVINITYRFSRPDIV
jgi:hypothetical protein